MFEKKSASLEIQTPGPSINKLSIHTMKKDLSDPSGAYATKASQEKISSLKGKSVESSSSPIKTDSPFLSAGWPNSNNETIDNSNLNNKNSNSSGIDDGGGIEKANSTTPDALIKSDILKSNTAKKEPQKNKSGSKHIIPAIIILFILILATGGGYYFWKTRMTPPQPAKTTTANQNQKPSVSQTPLPTIATDKPNYLSIDIKKPNADTIKKSLADYAEKVTQSKATVPVAFIITDAQNNPISFQDFEQALGLSLSQSLMSQLGPGFTLYMYTDTGNTRVGLAIAEKNDSQLAATLIQEEANLPKNFEPIFLASSYALNNKPFSDSSYNGTPIRFVNIISPIDLSVDYTIYQNQLLIGTTKTTLRSMINLLNSQNQNNQTRSTTGNAANPQ